MTFCSPTALSGQTPADSVSSGVSQPTQVDAALRQLPKRSFALKDKHGRPFSLTTFDQVLINGTGAFIPLLQVTDVNTTNTGYEVQIQALRSTARTRRFRSSIKPTLVVAGLYPRSRHLGLAALISCRTLPRPGRVRPS